MHARGAIRRGENVEFPRGARARARCAVSLQLALSYAERYRRASERPTQPLAGSGSLPAARALFSKPLVSASARRPLRAHKPAGIMSDESDDVSPPTAEPLLFEILRTIETAKEMPDDCPMHLQDFFDLVSARASLTPSLPVRLRMAAARWERVSSCVHRALWTLQVHGRACPCTALAHPHLSTPHRARCCVPLGRFCARSSRAHLAPTAPSSSCSPLLPSAPLAGLPSRTWQKGLHRHQGVARRGPHPGVHERGVQAVRRAASRAHVRSLPM